jgi:hypothetical protein
LTPEEAAHHREDKRLRMAAYYARIDAADAAAREEEDEELGAEGPADERLYGERLSDGFRMLNGHTPDGVLLIEDEEDDGHA